MPSCHRGLWVKTNLEKSNPMCITNSSVPHQVVILAPVAGADTYSVLWRQTVLQTGPLHKPTIVSRHSAVLSAIVSPSLISQLNFPVFTHLHCIIYNICSLCTICLPQCVLFPKHNSVVKIHGTDTLMFLNSSVN